jgi:hypothetical protein
MASLPVNLPSITSSSLHYSPPVSTFTTSSTSCGEQGLFTLTFDDLPNFHPINATDITQQPPIFSPYHHLSFSHGFVYANQPDQPFRPASPPHVAAFLAVGTELRSNGDSDPGEIGDGPRAADSAYWFDALEVFVGCDNDGPHGCNMTLTGYKWDPVTHDEMPAVTHTFMLPPCVGFVDCRLSQVAFPSTFRGLSGLQIQAFVKDDAKMFFIDDLRLSWSDTSCAAGLLRAASW